MAAIKRNYGIDLLRMVLMYMVVILHLLGHGGVLSASDRSGGQYAAAWLLESFAYCAINCYGLITGYVHFGSKYRLTNLAMIWLQAFFYSALIAAGMWYLGLEEFSGESLKTFLLPVSHDGYWYVTAYAGLFLGIPMLNAGVRALEEKAARIYMAGLFLVFSVLPTLARGDIFQFNSGYSAFWLAYLYALGACMRKFGWGDGVTGWKALAVYLGCVVLSWWVKTGSEAMLGTAESRLKLLNYTAPTMVLAAAALLVLFKNGKPPRWLTGIVGRLSPAAFGVYLIHEHTWVRAHCIKKRFVFLTEFAAPRMLLGVLGCALGIFGVCLLADLIRGKVFAWLRIKERLLRLEDRCRRNWL